MIHQLKLHIDSKAHLADSIAGLGFLGRWACLALPDALIFFSRKCFESSMWFASVKMFSHNVKSWVWFLPIKDVSSAGISTQICHLNAANIISL